jgi:hypothetical protein
MARPALLALALCGWLGAVVNDAGVTVPAIMGGFVLPMLVAHLVWNWRASPSGEEAVSPARAPR